MKKKLKKVASILRSWPMITAYILVVFLTASILFYRSVPLPNIDDGYLIDETRTISKGAPLTLHFGQPMDRASVEGNFSITPGKDGSFKWTDPSTMQFIPDTPFEINEDYFIVIGSEAKSRYYKSFGVDFKLHFVVAGSPIVKFISPFPRDLSADTSTLNDSTDASDDSGFVEDLNLPDLSGDIVIPEHQPITVMFDRPMRALSSLDDSLSQSGLPDLLIHPSVKGQSRWIGTTAFQFVPDAWIPGTTYQLTLPKGIKSLDGGETEEAITWSLSTPAPEVVNSFPNEGSDTFSVNGAIRVTFNQPMELDLIRPSDNVLLYPSNDLDALENPKMDGFFNTQATYGKDKDGNEDRSTLIFTPEFPYLYDTDYRLVIPKGLQGASSLIDGFGNRFMKEDFVLLFHTAKKPEVVSFLPENGDLQYQDSTISIHFASAMDEEEVLKRSSLNPPAEKDPVVTVSEFYTRDGGTVWEALIDYGLLPSKYYEFSFEGPFEDLAGNVSEKGFKTSFKTGAKKPYLSLLAPNRFGLFTEGLDPVYSVRTINITQLNVELCEVSESDFFRTSDSYQWYQYNCINPERKTLDLRNKLNDTLFTNLNLKDIFDRDFSKGIYFFEVSSRQYLNYNNEPQRFYQTFFVSDTNITVKKSGHDLLVWVTDLKTGEPVSRMELSILSSSGKEIKRGVTDGDGLYKLTYDFSEGVYVVGRKTISGENRWGLVSQYWNEGVESWQFPSNGDWVGYDEPRIYLFTERPLYRGGDELYYKGIYRLDQDLNLKLPTDKKIRIVLEDPEYNEIYSQEIGLLADGSFNGKINLDESAKLGRYNLYAETVALEYPQRFYQDFFVEEYKKPKFKVEILGSKVNYLAGDNLTAEVRASYYFGGAIQEANAHYTLMREPYTFDRYKGDGYYSFGLFKGFYCFWGGCSSPSEIVSEGDGTLDRNGSLKLDLPTTVDEENSDKENSGSYLYTLSVNVENQDGESVANRETFIVHQGSYYIGLSPRSYVLAPDDNLQLSVVTVDPEAQLVSGKKMNLEVYKEEWNTVKKQGVDGAFYDENVRDLKFIDRQSFTSGSEPKIASISLGGFEAGQYVVMAKGQEGKNEIVSETNFYVSSYATVNWGSENNNRMELVPDQPEYFVGGKARVLIKSPFGSEDEPAKALVTYERGGISHYEVIDVKSGSDVIEVPITEDMVPNVYVNVIVMKGAGDAFDRYLDAQDSDRLADRKTLLEATISQAEKDIEALKTSEGDELSNRAAILIGKKERALTDLKNELAVVNEKMSTADTKSSDAVSSYNLIKPDFRMGIVNLPVSKREHEIIVELTPSKPSYRSGEEVSIEIHTKDYQNRPLSSVVSLAVVDESLLALKANQKVNPLDYFYGQRALQVSTATALTIHVDRVDVNAQKGAKGGDGGGNDEGFNKQRGEFKDTAYFNPFIQTDNGGYAKITFTPPDNLTSWQIWAVATSDTDRFGMEKQDFIVKKPVSISPVLPRFVISGDELKIGALVHNQSGKDIETKVELKAPGLILKSPVKQSLFVRDGETQRLDWMIAVNSVTSDSEITIGFSSAEDAVQTVLPVNTFAFPEVVALSGTVDESVTEAVRVPRDVSPGMGGLSVRAGGSLITRLMSAYEALSDYPYGCAEQITSRILPTLLIQSRFTGETDNQWLEWFGIDPEQSRKIVSDTLQKISTFQRFDGGYGFWQGSSFSYPMLTAYVLYAQYLSTEADFSVSENSTNLAQQYLWRQLNQTDPRYKLSPDDRAFVLWVLSEVGQNDTGMALSLFENRGELSLYAKGLMMMNLENLLADGQRSVRPFIDKLKSEIVSEQISDDRTVHFEEKSHSFWDLNTNMRTNAILLMALNRDNPKNPILSKMVAYLSSAKPSRYLINTQETAWMLNAMFEYADSRDAFEPDFKLSVKLNHDKLLDGTIDALNAFSSFETDVPLSDLVADDGLNELLFSKDGVGEMSYDVEFKYYLPNEKIWPLEKGFQVIRQYYEFDGTKDSKLVQTMKSGGIYRGELTLLVPEDMHFVVAEERLPAGLEAINFNLDTSDTSLDLKLEQSQKTDETGMDYYWYENPLWYFNHIEMRDDRVLLFADRLPKGVYTYSFLVRAGLPGMYHHLPASAFQMYFPEVFGRTGGELLEIKE